MDEVLDGGYFPGTLLNPSLSLYTSNGLPIRFAKDVIDLAHHCMTFDPCLFRMKIMPRHKHQLLIIQHTIGINISIFKDGLIPSPQPTAEILQQAINGIKLRGQLASVVPERESPHTSMLIQ